MTERRIVIRLQKSDAKVYRGRLRYLVAYDHAAGKKDRYTVYALTTTDPVTIGRELDLSTVRDLLARYEAEACGRCVETAAEVKAILARVSQSLSTR